MAWSCAMRRCAPLLSVLSSRLRDAEQRRTREHTRWEDAWRAADASDGQRALVLQRVDAALALRDRDVRSALQGCRSDLAGQRDALHSAVVRLVRDAQDQAAMAPYIGHAPSEVIAARDRAIAGLVAQWTLLVQRDVLRANEALQRLSRRHPWSDPDVVTRELERRLGGVPWPVPAIPAVPVIQVNVEQVLCQHGAIQLDASGPTVGEPSIQALTAWAEDVARRTPREVPAIGWDHVRDTWGRM